MAGSCRIGLALACFRMPRDFQEIWQLSPASARISYGINQAATMWLPHPKPRPSLLYLFYWLPSKLLFLLRPLDLLL